MTEFIWGNVGVATDVTGDQDGIYYIYGNVGVPATESSRGNEYIWGNTEHWVLQSASGNYISGETNNYMFARASIYASATTIVARDYSAVVSGTTSVAPSYPANSSNGDLVLFLGGLKQYYNTFSNANFKRGASANYIFWTNRTSDPQDVGEDAGSTRAEHHYRILTAAASGTETFTNVAGDLTNTSASGQMIRFTKSSSEEWLVSSRFLGTLSYYNNEFGGSSATQYGVGDKSIAVKLSSSPIRSIGNDPDNGIGIAVGNGVWRTQSGKEWAEKAFPFGTDYATRVEFGNGIWIMVGMNGKMSRSTDGGMTWATAGTPLGTGHLYGLKYANNRWIVTGASGLIATSDDDGLNWTTRTSGVTSALYGAAWGDGSGTTKFGEYPPGGFWFVCGANRRIIKSEDNGNTWSIVTWDDNGLSGNLLDIQYVAYGKNSYHFVASGDVEAGRHDQYVGYNHEYHTHAILQDWGDGFYWKHGSSGYYYGNLYVYDWDAVSYWEGIAYARAIATNGYGDWNWATNRRDFYYNRLGLEGYAAKYALLGGDKPQYSPSPDPELWEQTYTPNSTEDDFFLDGRRGYWMYGVYSGTVFVQEESTYYVYPGNTLEYAESYTSHFEINDGDIVVFTAVVSNTAEDWSNLVIEQEHSASSPPNVIYEPITPLWTSGPITIISSEKITAGQNQYVISGYFTSKSRLERCYYAYKWYSDPWTYNFWRPVIDFTVTSDDVSYPHEKAHVVAMTIISTGTFGPRLTARASITAEAERRYHGLGPECQGATANMSMTAIAHVDPVAKYSGDLSYNYTETSGQTLTLSTSSVIPAGALIVAYAAMDNASGTTPVITASDNKGNTWTTNIQTFQGTSAAAGVTTAVMSANAATTTTGTYTLTITASVAVKCRIIGAKWFTGAGTSTAAITAGAGGSGTTTTVSQSNIQGGDLVVGIVGWESDVSATLDSDTTSGSWITMINGLTGTGGNAATHIRLAGQYKIPNAGGTQTYNTTTPSTDWATDIVVWRTPKAVSLYNFINASLDATVVLIQAKNTTAPLSTTASMTVEATVDVAAGEVAVLDAIAVDTFVAQVDYSTSSSSTAIATIEVASYLSVFHYVDTYFEPATATITATAITPKTYEVTASFEATASIRAGYTYETSVSVMNAAASLSLDNNLLPNPGDSVYVENPNDPAFDFTPYDPPEYGYSAGYGFGDLFEITNRYYQKRYQVARIPSLNGYPSRYSCGAVAGEVIHLGGNRVLAVWVQENYKYTTNNTTPPILVASIIDCNSRDPVLVTQERYNLPVSARSWRNKSVAYMQHMVDDDPIHSVFYMANGHTENDNVYPPLDEGIQDNYHDKHSSFSIAAKVDVDGDTITIDWVKLWGGVYSSAGGRSETIGNTKSIEAIHNGDIIISLAYTGGILRFVRVNFETGEWTDVGPAWYAGEFPNWWAGGQRVYVGDDLYSLGAHGYTGETLYMKFDLRTLTWDGEYRQGLQYNGMPIAPIMFRVYRAPKHPVEGEQSFSFAFVDGVGGDSDKRIRVLKWFINPDGVPEVSEIWSSDIACIPTDIWNWVGGQPIYGGYGDPNDTNYGDYSIAEDDLRPIADDDEYDTYSLIERYLYADWSNFEWFSCSHRADEFTLVYHSTQLGDGEDYPFRAVGAQCVYKFDTEDMMGRAAAWYSAPPNNPTWQSFFILKDDQYYIDKMGQEWWDVTGQPYYQKTLGLSYLAQTVGCMLDNGSIFVLLTATVNGHADQYENGEYRAFMTIVKVGDPPPLKMTQRDDGARDGGERIGYVPVNGDSQRIASETY